MNSLAYAAALWGAVKSLPPGSALAASASLLIIVLAFVDLWRQRRSKNTGAIVRDSVGIALSVTMLTGTLWGSIATRASYNTLAAQVASQQVVLDSRRGRHISTRQSAILKKDLLGLEETGLKLTACNATTESKEFATELAAALRAGGLRVDYSPITMVMCVGVAAPLQIMVFAPHTATRIIGNKQDALRSYIIRAAFVDAGLLDPKARITLLSPQTLPHATPPPNISIEVWPI
jgi:hypothetical protein